MLANLNLKLNLDTADDALLKKLLKVVAIVWAPIANAEGDSSKASIASKSKGTEGEETYIGNPTPPTPIAPLESPVVTTNETSGVAVVPPGAEVV